MDSEIEISAHLVGGGDGSERTNAMEDCCRDLEKILPSVGTKHQLGVVDTLCCLAAVIGKTADLTDNRIVMAAIMQKWADVLRDPQALITMNEPAGHA